MWTCRVFLVGDRRDWRGWGFLFVFCLYCGVCLFSKLFRNTTYHETLTAQRTFLELWHYLAMELIRYPWCIVAASCISGVENSTSQFKRDFNLFPHNFVPQFYRKYETLLGAQKEQPISPTLFHTHSFLVWEFHLLLFLKKLWHLKGCR